MGEVEGEVNEEESLFLSRALITFWFSESKLMIIFSLEYQLYRPALPTAARTDAASTALVFARQDGRALGAT